MNSNYKSVIVGFDLGHAEFALTMCVYNQREQEIQEKEELEKIKNEEKIKKGEYLKILKVHGKQSQITAISYEDGITTIGDGAWENTKDTNKVTKFEICFKQKPSSELFLEDTIKDFINTVYYSLIKGDNQEKPQLLEKENNYYFIGYPSGWSSKEGKEYQEVLVKSDLPNVKVVPESRAAFMHAKESRTTFKKEDLRKSVLVIDCGSSTIDYTAVKLDNRGYYAKPIDFGYDLGASLIEQAILKITIQNHEKEDFIHNLFNQYPHLQRRFEIACRQAKEEYFKALEDQKKNPVNYQNNSNLETPVSCSIEDVIELDEELIPLVNKQIMNKILHDIRLSDLLDECRINGKFIETFKKQLKESKTRLEKDGYNPSAIFLTGGACRMYFIAEECQKVFQNTKIIQDIHPEVSIAKGLTRWGHIYHRKEQVKSEIDGFVNNDLSSIIESKIDRLLNDIAKTLASTLVKEVVKPGIKAWKSCQIRTIADLEKDLKQKVEHFFNKECSQKKEKPITDFLKLLQKDVNKTITLILQKYNFNKDGDLAKKLITNIFDVNIKNINLSESIFEIINKNIHKIVGSLDIAKIIILVANALIVIVYIMLFVVGAGGFFIFPPALLIAGIIALGVAAFKAFTNIEVAKNIDFSKRQRNKLNKQKLNKICQEIKSALIIEIKEQLKNKQQTKKEIIESTKKEIQTYMQQISNDILNEYWWIIS